MSKRNIWTDDEVKCFLHIMKEKKVLNLLFGRKNLNKNVFKMVESEMHAYGFENKNTEQIILKWRKLKSEYNKTKRQNEISGRYTAHCPFEDEINEILEAQPKEDLEDADINSSYCGSERNIELEVEDPFYSDSLSSESLQKNEPESPNESQQSTTQRKVRRKRTTPYEKAMSDCTKEFLSVQEKLQKDFFARQKELIEYEHQLQQKHDKEFLKDLMFETAKLLKDSRKFLFQTNNIKIRKNNSM